MLDIPDVISDDVTQVAVDPVPAPPDAGELSADAFDAEGYAYWESALSQPSFSTPYWPWVLPEDLTIPELLELLKIAFQKTHGAWWDCQFWSLQAFSFNCTVAVSQDILTAYGINISEGELTEIMIREGWLTEEGGSLATVGATLDSGGIPSHTVVDATLDDVIAELVAGHKVVIPVDSSELWDHSVFGRLWDWMTDLWGGEADHVVWITEIDMSDPDNPMVTINDTGHPDGQGAQYPLNELRGAWADGHFSYVATSISPAEYVTPPDWELYLVS